MVILSSISKEFSVHKSKQYKYMCTTQNFNQTIKSLSEPETSTKYVLCTINFSLFFLVP